MKANNRKSLLPQPHNRSLDIGAHQTPATEQDAHDVTRAKRASVLYTRPTSRIEDKPTSVARPGTRSRPDSVHGSNDGTILSIPNAANAHKRSFSVRSATGHVKSGSHGNAGSISTSHELKIPTRKTQLARSDTVSSVSSRRPTLDNKSQGVRTDSRASTAVQQQQSPIKPSLPKTTGIARSGSVVVQDDTTALSDTNRAQIELFQLSLIHEQALKALASYEASAEKSLGERHSYLRDMLRELIVLEQRRAKEVNLEALSKWPPHKLDLVDMLQTLSSIYHETIALTADDSSFSATVLSFQDWVLGAEERLNGVGGQGIDQLPEQWRHAHASTALSVRSLQRQLTQLPVPEPSSLATVMKACGSLLDATLRELDMMTKLEAMLLDMDRVRINEAVTASALLEQVLEVPQLGPLSWRAV